MSDWRPSTWGDEIALEYGKAIRGYQSAVGEFRVFGTNGPIGWTNDALAKGPGVILGRKGAYRGIHFCNEPFWVIDTAYYVRPLHDQLDIRWLYYAIKFHKLGQIDDGSPIPSTTRAAVYVRELDIPSLPEQKAIAKCLSVYDDKIRLNQRMNETLEALARAVFKDWFVDFGPTRRKAGGETDSVAILGGLLLDPSQAAQLATLFPDRIGINGLPEGWEEKPLVGFLEIIGGGRLRPRSVNIGEGTSRGFQSLILRRKVTYSYGVLRSRSQKEGWPRVLFEWFPLGLRLFRHAERLATSLWRHSQWPSTSHVMAFVQLRLLVTFSFT